MLRFKEYLSLLRELTVSPDYRQGNTFNPFYDLTKGANSKVKSLLKDKKNTGIKNPSREKWNFRNVYQGEWIDGAELLHDFSKQGKTYFQITTSKKIDIPYYIKGAQSLATGHEGMTQRKSATASSDINELMSLYFLVHPTEKAGTKKIATTWLRGTKRSPSIPFNTTGSIGVVKGDATLINYNGKKSMSELFEKPDADAITNIQIGWHNARAVEKDLKTILGNRTIQSYHWVPKVKPNYVNSSNPSDIILKLSDDSFIGYSNKATVGKDTTPKFNTNINAFYGKSGDTTQLTLIQSIMNDSWNHAVKSVDSQYKNATTALNNTLQSVLDANFTESNLKKTFAKLGRAFNDDKLNFFAADFYYPYRNTFITKFVDHLMVSENLSYFLKTISSYTFATGGDPCPYKLLVGTTGGSTIKDISSDDALRDILGADSKYLTDIVGDYDGKKQSFKLSFKVGKQNITIPITARTRATGGWAGKALYIETPGVKVI
jgi:hypothetical protein